VEYRSETLSATNSISTTYGRPWGRVNAGLAFPTPFVKPFIGLEVAMPLTKTNPSATEYMTSDSTGLKAHAPKLQLGIYGGIRF
jgi:hypothetical protein